MTNYIVHIYREMRLSYADIEADTPQAAAADRGRQADRRRRQCRGLRRREPRRPGRYGRGRGLQPVRNVDFEAERIRKAAAKLLASLEAILPYAENEAYSLEKLKDSPEAEAEAERAWKSVETAQAIVAEAKAAGMTPAPGEFDGHAVLSSRRQIAAVWGIEDVREMRPDLTADQCWEVLEATDRRHDATKGITWEVLDMPRRRCSSAMLPKADEAEET